MHGAVVIHGEYNIIMYSNVVSGEVDQRSAGCLLFSFYC